MCNETALLKINQYATEHISNKVCSLRWRHHFFGGYQVKNLCNILCFQVWNKKNMILIQTLVACQSDINIKRRCRFAIYFDYAWSWNFYKKSVRYSSFNGEQRDNIGGWSQWYRKNIWDLIYFCQVEHRQKMNLII